MWQIPTLGESISGPALQSARPFATCWVLCTFNQICSNRLSWSPLYFNNSWVNACIHEWTDSLHWTLKTLIWCMLSNSPKTLMFLHKWGDLKFQTKIKLVSSMGLLIVDTHERTERSKGGTEIMLTSIWERRIEDGGFEVTITVSTLRDVSSLLED